MPFGGLGSRWAQVLGWIVLLRRLAGGRAGARAWLRRAGRSSLADPRSGLNSEHSQASLSRPITLSWLNPSDRTKQYPQSTMEYAKTTCAGCCPPLNFWWLTPRRACCVGPHLNLRSSPSRSLPLLASKLNSAHSASPRKPRHHPPLRPTHSRPRSTRPRPRRLRIRRPQRPRRRREPPTSMTRSLPS